MGVCALQVFGRALTINFFIPKGSNQAYEEHPNPESVKKFRRRAVMQLVEHLKKNKR
jgi:hypothetical protein